jgi:hypothetical protein
MILKIQILFFPARYLDECRISHTQGTTVHLARVVGMGEDIVVDAIVSHQFCSGLDCGPSTNPQI